MHHGASPHVGPSEGLVSRAHTNTNADFHLNMPSHNEDVYGSTSSANVPVEQQQSLEYKIVSYHDNIKVFDFGNFLRKFGITLLPSSPFHHLWFVKDSCGIFGAVVTWILIVFGEICLILFVLIPFQLPWYSLVNALFSVFCAFLGFWSHLRAMFSDPGCVPRGNATKENIAKLGLKEGQVVFKCQKCSCIKPDRTHHCSVCKRCVRKMDHHCPWINNCVGENNQKFFVLFTFYICVISIHAIYITIHHFVLCVNNDWKGCSATTPVLTTIFLIFLLFESLLFGIFTAIMFCTQIDAISSDVSGIEHLKGEKNRRYGRRSRWANIRSVFGPGPFGFTWLSPFHSVLNDFNKDYNEISFYNV